MLNTSSQIINDNKARVYLYMLVLTLFVGVLGHFLSQNLGFGLSGTGIALLIAGGMNFFAYFFSDRLVLATSGAKPMTPTMAPDYFAMVKELCHKAQIPMPKLYMIDDQAMNAFATGRDHKNAVVAVTRGLLEKLEMDEVRGVVAHELSHIKHYDMLVMTVISVMAGVISIMADMFWHATHRAQERDNSGILQWIGLALALFAPITAMLVQLAISRGREYMADAEGARLTGFR